jgi:hypothetical protein
MEAAEDDEGWYEVENEPLGRRVLPWLVLTLCVIMGGVFWRLETINITMDRLEDSAAASDETTLKANVAIVDLRDQLRTLAREAEVSRPSTQSDLPERPFAELLEAVERIEDRLCGGPCEEGET